MARQIKVFSMNYDGKNSVMAACHSLTEFAKLVNAGYQQVRNYGGPVGEGESAELAKSKPFRLFIKPILGGEWKLKE